MVRRAALRFDHRRLTPPSARTASVPATATAAAATAATSAASPLTPT